MSTATARLQMKHLCVIERDANAGTANARGNPNPPDWQPHTTDVPCLAWTTIGKERVEDEAVVGFENQRIMLPLGTDVTERDRIGDVTYRDDLYIEGPIGIRAVIRQRDFLELVLVRVTG